jgi:hypothetical protein
MKIYIAGPMRGIPQYNFPAFHRAAKLLRLLDWEVISPAEIDNAEGFDESTPESELTKKHLLRFILRDIELVSTSDAICMLPDSHNSPGAQVELAMARYMNISIYYIDADWHLQQLVKGEDRS